MVVCWVSQSDTTYFLHITFFDDLYSNLTDFYFISFSLPFFFLEIALDREVEGDLCLHDIGQGFGFRAGSFDGAIRLILKYPIQTGIPKKKKKVEAR